MRSCADWPPMPTSTACGSASIAAAETRCLPTPAPGPYPTSTSVLTLVRRPDDEPARWIRAHDSSGRPDSARRQPTDEQVVRIKIETEGTVYGSLWAVRPARPGRPRSGGDSAPLPRRRPGGARTPTRPTPPGRDERRGRPSKRCPEERPARLGLARHADATREHPCHRREPGGSRRGLGPGRRPVGGQFHRHGSPAARSVRPIHPGPESHRGRRRCSQISRSSTRASSSKVPSPACDRAWRHARSRPGRRVGPSVRPGRRGPLRCDPVERPRQRRRPHPVRRPGRDPRRARRIRAASASRSRMAGPACPMPTCRSSSTSSSESVARPSGARRGMGIGLSIVRGWPRRWAGPCRPDDRRSAGSGIDLRCRLGAGAGRRALDARPGSTVTATGARILLVEDDDPTRDSVAANLTAHGFRVVEAVGRPLGDDDLGDQPAGRHPPRSRSSGCRRDRPDPACPTRVDHPDPGAVGQGRRT